MTTHRSKALGHLADAIEAHEQLTAAHAFQPRDFDLVGRLKSAERFHLGVAQVYATLAAAEAMPVPYTVVQNLTGLAGPELEAAVERLGGTSGR